MIQNILINWMKNGCLHHMGFYNSSPTISTKMNPSSVSPSSKIIGRVCSFRDPQQFKKITFQAYVSEIFSLHFISVVKIYFDFHTYHSQLNQISACTILCMEKVIHAMSYYNITLRNRIQISKTMLIHDTIFAVRNH